MHKLNKEFLFLLGQDYEYLNRQVSCEIDLPGAKSLKSVSDYFSPTTREEDWLFMAGFLQKNKIELGFQFTVDEWGVNYLWVSYWFSDDPLSERMKLSVALSKVYLSPVNESQKGYLTAKVLNAIGYPQKWNQMLEIENQKTILRVKVAAFLVAMRERRSTSFLAARAARELEGVVLA